MELFSHNQTAYAAAISMLERTGKAAIIHPTGTGKSFIGFKLCQEHPNQTICWLSPSEYIFKTQLENLRAAADGWCPENVYFFTYAKLMLMPEETIDQIRPEYIILDEFHRCGAELWGAGVKRLLARYPEAKILGLSATHIRYLDNQRDMAQELFDGNIASEMTLGEAIARGILKAPRYVMSVYAYQAEMDRLQRRVEAARNSAARDQAALYLEALRRALERAEGLDAIFDRHMTERTGKYIVFCADLEHLRQMQMQASAFFGRVDAAPHIYTAYSSDAATDRAFAAFQADQSDHLKLLYCIDMLNEGVHVENVAGVILFRPTVSPIVYKQQIGRALSVSGAATPVIFDVVNNIENLYAISTVQQEVRDAIARGHGQGGEFTDTFQIYDEVQDARVLFEKLNETLSAPWDVMYACAERYYQEHGNLEVPYRYKTPEGYSLGGWIAAQRKVYAGTQYGTLTPERIAQLSAIGMVWGGMHGLSWDRHCDAAREYYAAHGNLDVPAAYVTQDGLRLGIWLTTQRALRRSGELTKEQIRQLDAAGMVWDRKIDTWEKNYAACAAYAHSHGNLNIPAGYCTADGLPIGTWLIRQRDLRRGKAKGTPLTEEQIARLDAIGMVWQNKYEQAWERGYAAAKNYAAEHGDCKVPAAYVSPSGYRLGKWVATQREKGPEKLTDQQRQRLEALGITWKRDNSWDKRCALAEQYFRQHGNLQIPEDYRPEGVWMARWLSEQRQIYQGKRPGKSLTAQQIARLEAMGMEWGDRNRARWRSAWDAQYQEAKRFYDRNGHLMVPHDYRTRDGKKLDVWIQKQRQRKRQGKLSEKQTQLLSEIGAIPPGDTRPGRAEAGPQAGKGA